jgi:putative FmdB family regulatory protein
MPLYEYECKKCKHRFERIQKFSDPHVKKCPECGGAVEQVISAPAVQFKGSGWYVTDYGKGGSSGGSSKNGGEPGKSEDKSSSDKVKSESKPESKGESKSEAKKKTEKK